MEKRIELSNGIMISYIENSYNDNQYRVNIFRPSTLDSTHIGEGMGGGKEGILTQESAQKIFNKLKEEYDFSNYNFSNDDEKNIHAFIEDDIETI